MKRVLLTLLIYVMVASSVLANMIEDKITDAISLYKSGQYDECIKNLNTIIEQDSSYPITYYYLGLSYAKLNKKSLAIKNYDKVISSSSDKSLRTMAKAAKDCLGTSGFTALDAQLSISNDSKAERFIKPEIKKEFIKKKVDNETKKVSTQKVTKISESNNKMPTNDEIGEAIMILKRAGLWNSSTQNISQNSMNQNQQNPQDLMTKMYMQQMTQQMNNPAYLMMSMNGNNTNNNMNNMMNMLPFMMNNSNGSNPAMNQQFIQTMMMSQMMPNLDFSSSDKDR